MITTTLNATDILTGLYSLGFTVESDGESLRLSGPVDKLDERRKELIQQSKSELLLLLDCESEATAEACPHCGSADIASGRFWRWCLACESRLGVSDHMLFDAELVELGTIDAEFERLPTVASANCFPQNPVASGKELRYDKNRADEGLSPNAGSDQQTLDWKD